MMEDDEGKMDTFPYFNVDIHLLTLYILLEGYHRGENVFTLAQFLKGDYWKIDEIAYEIKDTGDYSCMEDLVLQQIVWIINDLEIGKIKRVSINSISGLAEEVIRKVLKEKKDSEEDEDLVMMYAAIIREIYDLKKINDSQHIKNEKFDFELHDRVDFNEDDFGRYIKLVSSIGSSYVELEIEFSEKGVKKVDKAINEYIEDYHKDQFIGNKPDYRQKRLYFSQQIENFFEYIKSFSEVDGYINIPFSSLCENGFEIVKILSYLERENRIKVRNWNDVDVWNVKFHKLPITLSSILGQKNKESDQILTINEEIKLNLSFSHETGVMILTDQKGKEYTIKVQGQVQKEVLRVFFKFPEKTYTEWSLYDISDTLGADDVNVRAVKNAIYQFNKKISLNIPSVKNLLILTKHSAQLNSKYINKT